MKFMFMTESDFRLLINIFVLVVLKHVLTAEKPEQLLLMKLLCVPL